ncbi:MAG TPA: hypothetical protein VLN59_11080, partial [Burkholderiales bacterium]|nr:hypothetical protein [Burkholderiales bacterium]
LYQFHKRGELTESRHITVVFDQDKLAHIEGDVVAAGEPKTDGGVTVQKQQAPADGPPAGGAAAPKSQ